MNELPRPTAENMFRAWMDGSPAIQAALDDINPMRFRKPSQQGKSWTSQLIQRHLDAYYERTNWLGTRHHATAQDEVTTWSPPYYPVEQLIISPRLAKQFGIRPVRTMPGHIKALLPKPRPSAEIARHHALLKPQLEMAR